MARSRFIKPSFFTSEQVALCSPLARLTFAGLWCLADRAGKLRDRPRQIRAELFPYQAEPDAEPWLAELSQAGLILRYVVDGERLIKIPGFERHQHIHIREAPSVLPEPGNSRASTNLGDAEPTASTSDPLPASTSAIGRASPASAVVAVLPCVGNGSHDYAVTQAEVDGWGEAFPGLDLKAEVLRAKAWLEANPDSRKPQSRVPKFLVSWFGRAKDSGGKPRKPLAFAPAEPASVFAKSGPVAL